MRENQPGTDQLFPLVYDELKRLARRYLRRERSSHTLQPTALVNEAYIQLSSLKSTQWQSRSHFMGVAALAMRRVLTDYARDRRTAKRGGGNIMIDKELLEILACPLCKEEVRLTADGNGLKCVKCHRVYPIRDDIPVMLIDEAKIDEES